MKKATLRLQDGTEFQGYSFGAELSTSGEVVCNTAMAGYPESLTDPSAAGQIMVLTYPLVGGYGVPSTEALETNGLRSFMESEKIWAKALVVGDYSPEFSHWNAKESLGEWMKREGIPGITGVDTRQLTKLLREKGTMTGVIIPEGVAEATQAEECNQVGEASCKEVVTYQPTGASINKRVVVVDCGIKHSIIKYLLDCGVEVVRVPWNYDFNGLSFDALFLADGPGDPGACTATVENIKKFLAAPAVRPCMGICMGNQLLAMAAGATTTKLKNGHHGHSVPVREVGGTKCYVTTQNHNYTVDASTLNSDWEEWFQNMNDGSNEGIRHKKNPWFAVQFQPETNPEAGDTKILFNKFIETLK